MVYDFIKILKKCLKYWYIFVGTVILLIASLLFLVRPIMIYKASCDISVVSINKKQVINDTGCLDYYESLNESVMEITKNYYVEDNIKEINELFKTDDKLKLKIEIEEIGNSLMYRVQVMHPNRLVAKDVLEFVKSDLIEYVDDVSKQEVPIEYQITNSSKIYNIKEPSKTLQDGVVNFCLISIALIVIEIIIFGIITLKDNKFEFEEELKTEFNSNSLIKNYDKNHELTIKTIKENNLDNIIFICANIDYAKNILKDSVNKFKTYKTIKDLKDLEVDNQKNVLLEIVKGETSKADVEKVIREFNKINFKNYYFITRNKERSNEGSSNK